MIAGPFTVTIPAGGTGATLETPPISGLILEAGLKFTFDGGSTMNVTIATKGASSLAKTLLTLTGVSTNTWYPIRQALVGTNGAALTGQYAPISVSDPLIITVAAGGAGDKLDVALEVR